MECGKGDYKMTATNIWIQNILAEKTHKSEKYAGVMQSLHGIIKKELPELYLGQKNGRITRKKMKSIMSLIKQSGCYGAILYQRDMFDVIVRLAVERYGWKSTPVYMFFLRRREASRYSLAKFLGQQNCRMIEKILLRTIIDLKKLSVEQRTSQIALSAIIFGGLLEKAELVDLVGHGIEDNNSFKGYMWFDLSVNKKKAVPGTIRRWFSDPISSQLLRRYRRDAKKQRASLSLKEFVIGEKWNEDVLWQKILELLKTYQLPGEELPKTLAELLKWSTAALDISIPPYVVDFATGRNPSYSMMHKAWMRALTGEPTIEINVTPKDKKVSYREVQTNKMEGKETGSRVVVSSYESGIIRRIEQIIVRDDIEGLEKHLDELGNILSPTLQYITEYYIALMKGRAPGRFKHKGESIKKYFDLGKELVAQAQGRDIKVMEIESIEDLYENIFEKQGTQKRQAFAGNFLKKFHNYLAKKYELERIVFEELDGFVSGRHSVNANVITPQHYKETLGLLWESREFDDRIECIRYLMTVLAFRMNMRRQEIRRLRLCDVRLTRTQIFVRVTDTEDGKVKSASGKRWLPAHDLFDDEEQQFLRKWYEFRSTETRARRALLFTENSNDIKLISRYKTFDAILKVLRKVTGDSKIRFHSLRHSFATWLLLSIEANRIPEVLDPRLNVFSPQGGIQQAKFKTILDGTQPTKKILYQLALLMGHSTPSMTLLHYIHSCDWILYHWVCRRIPHLTPEQIAPLLGRDVREVKKVIKDSGIAMINKKIDLIACLEIAEWPLKR